MSSIDEIAFNLGIRNEEPNKALALKLAQHEDAEGIAELAAHLDDKNKSIASDCLAVLYHVGYEKPELIAEHIDQFFTQLTSKNNRMVWGSMIALACLAPIAPEKVFAKVDLIFKTIANGSVITEVWGLTTLAHIAAANRNFHAKIFPVLCDYLSRCRPIDFAKRIETVLPTLQNKPEYSAIADIVQTKVPDLSDAQRKKLKSVLAKFHKSSGVNLYPQGC